MSHSHQGSCHQISRDINRSERKRKQTSNGTQSDNRQTYQFDIMSMTKRNGLATVEVYDENLDDPVPAAVNTVGGPNEEAFTTSQTKSPRKYRKKVTGQKVATNEEIDVKKAIKAYSCTNRAPVNPKTKKNRNETDHSSAEAIAIDPVIEQWYADPYNRYDPDGPADVQLRRHVLTTALRNRGFGGARILNIVNWLLRCKGQHKTYEDLVGANRIRRGRRHKVRHVRNAKSSESQPRQPSLLANTINGGSERNVNGTAPIDLTGNRSVYPSPISIQDETNDTENNANEQHNPNTNPTSRGNSIFEDNEDLFINFNLGANADTDPNVNPELDIELETDTYSFTSTVEHEAIMQQVKEEIVGTRPSFHSRHTPGTKEHQDDYNDWRLEDLERTQKFWSIIYGDDLDATTTTTTGEEASVKFTYFRDPGGVSRPDVWYPSQGLKPMKRISHMGKEVLTEDETFGLYVPTKEERLA